MSRAQQGAIESTETGNSATSTAAATKSQQAEQSDINQNQSQLAKFAADNPYMQGGAYQTAQNQTIAGAADASAEGAKAAAQSQAERTGQNPAAANAAAITAAQNAQRTAGSEQGSATTSRLASEAGYNQEALNAGNAITSQQAALTGNLTGEAQGQENTAEQAAQTPSFLDELGSGLITGADDFAGAAGTALCPAEGSSYLMADGTERPVETLALGELIEGIDGDPQRILDIRIAFVKTVRIEVTGGFMPRTSRSHTYALQGGGFVEAWRSGSKLLQTAKGVGKVLFVEPAGMARVFNVVTDGSHTYRVDGVWSFGVGESESGAAMEFLEEEMARA